MPTTTPTSGKSRSRKDPVGSVLHPVHPVPLRVKIDGVHVDLVSKAVSQNEVRFGTSLSSYVASDSEHVL